MELSRKEIKQKITLTAILENPMPMKAGSKLKESGTPGDILFAR